MDLQHGNAAFTPKKKGRYQSYAYYLKNYPTNLFLLKELHKTE